MFCSIVLDVLPYINYNENVLHKVLLNFEGGLFVGGFLIIYVVFGFFSLKA